MIGVVIVSHSARLAEGVVELARGMAGDDLRIAAAGGLDMPDSPLGTDAFRVMNAIEQVYSPDGVLILVDLGSALLSAEMAVEQFEEEQRQHLLICAAPLVEGAVTAAVQARLGQPLDIIAAEAQSALAPKLAHLGQDSTVTIAPSGPSSKAQHEIRAHIDLPHGLHARPAAKFVTTLGAYDVQATLQNTTSGRGPVNANSLNAIATLGIQRGHDILITLKGRDVTAAAEAVQRLIESRFGEAADGAAFPSKTPPPEIQTRGAAAAPGIAAGPVHWLTTAVPLPPPHPAEQPDDEWSTLQQALQTVSRQISADQERLAMQGLTSEAEIFDVHRLMLADPLLIDQVKQNIYQMRMNAAKAWDSALREQESTYAELDDPYLRERAADVAALRMQVLRSLLGTQGTVAAVDQPCIVLADDLTPAQTAALNPAIILGIAARHGGATGHSAILARALGIPAVVGLGAALDGLHDGDLILIDGDAGIIIPHPDEAAQTAAHSRAESLKQQRQNAQAKSHTPAITRRGQQVEVGANVGSLADAQLAQKNGADGIGLLRSEFLFLDRQTAPSEEEQFQVYCRIAETMEGRPVILRTLDVGGDKPLPYLPMLPETNPFLGVRGLRLSLKQPELFKTQLRAACRAAALHPIRLMFPMVTSLAEWHAARTLVAQAREDLISSGIALPEPIPMGIMVEVPSAALLASQFAEEVAFFSLGTNDLTQYTMAAERSSSALSHLLEPPQPAVMQLIESVVEAAHERGKWVGVCGELASSSAVLATLVQLGIDELSVSPPLVPSIKEQVRAQP